MSLPKYQRELMREAYLKLLRDIHPTAFITLATNRDIPAIHMRSLVKKYFERIDRFLLGRRWYKKSVSERTNGLVFLEKVGINTHAHCAAALSLNKLRYIKDESASIWQELCPSGSVVFDLMSDQSNRAKYMLKEQIYLRNYDFADQIILLSEFVSFT